MNWQRVWFYASFNETKAAKEILIDFWDVEISNPTRWETLREEIKTHGLRNSLMIAVAPTATIASITGCYECIEPQFLTSLNVRHYL